MLFGPCSLDIPAWENKVTESLFILAFIASKQREALSSNTDTL